MTNKEIKQIQSLAQKKHRQECGQFLIEGKRLVQSAVDMNANIDAIYITDLFLQGNEEVVNGWESNGGHLEKIPSKTMDKISLTKSSSGVTAICQLPKNESPDTSQKKWLYLDHISDPGNLGTLFRSAAWFGFKHIALSSDCVDPFNPKVVRAGMGAHFGLYIHNDISLDLFVETHTLVGADHRGTPLKEFIVPKCSVLVLGSEAHGLSESAREYLHELVAIEKVGFGESLNVSIAGAIMMEQFSS